MDCPACGGRVVRLRYEPRFVEPGRAPSFQVLDLPPVATGRDGLRTPAELDGAGVHRVGSLSTGRCRRTDHEHEMEPFEEGFTLHFATHPECKDELLREKSA